jgi:hypothetical protein
MMKTMFVAAAIVCVAVVSPVRAHSRAGQQTSSPAVTPNPDAPVTPAEVEKMFEAVALVRAQEALKLDDDKYLVFLTKYKALQEARRRTQQERQRLMRDLNQLTRDGDGDEAQIKDRLKAMADLDARAEGEIHKAYDAIDAVLDVRQQARFRLFEQNMELQKLSLVERARQANRQQKKPN